MAAVTPRQEEEEGTAKEQEVLSLRRFVYFAVESDQLPGRGNVHGILCDVRPAFGINNSRPHNSISVLASVTSLAEGAFRVATSWVVGLMQTGSLAEAGVKVRRRPLWEVSRVAWFQQARPVYPRIIVWSDAGIQHGCVSL